MSFVIKNPQAKWYVDLMEKFNTLMKKFSAPEDLADEFRVLLLETARSQYMAGNNSGIRWAREQAATAATASAA